MERTKGLVRANKFLEYVEIRSVEKDAEETVILSLLNENKPFVIRGLSVPSLHPSNYADHYYWETEVRNGGDTSSELEGNGNILWKKDPKRKRKTTNYGDFFRSIEDQPANLRTLQNALLPQTYRDRVDKVLPRPISSAYLDATHFTKERRTNEAYLFHGNLNSNLHQDLGGCHGISVMTKLHGSGRKTWFFLDSTTGKKILKHHGFTKVDFMRPPYVVDENTFTSILKDYDGNSKVKIYFTEQNPGDVVVVSPCTFHIVLYDGICQGVTFEKLYPWNLKLCEETIKYCKASSLSPVMPFNLCAIRLLDALSTESLLFYGIQEVDQIRSYVNTFIRDELIKSWDFLMEVDCDFEVKRWSEFYTCNHCGYMPANLIVEIISQEETYYYYCVNCSITLTCYKKVVANFSDEYLLKLLQLDSDKSIPVQPSYPPKIDDEKMIKSYLLELIYYKYPNLFSILAREGNSFREQTIKFIAAIAKNPNLVEEVKEHKLKLINDTSLSNGESYTPTQDSELEVDSSSDPEELDSSSSSSSSSSSDPEFDCSSSSDLQADNSEDLEMEYLNLEDEFDDIDDVDSDEENKNEDEDFLLSDDSVASEKVYKKRKTLNQLQLYEPLEPTLTIELYLHQKQGIERMKSIEESYFGGLLADEMGLGKTITSISFSVESKRYPVLVLCLANTKRAWLSEIEKSVKSVKVLLLEKGTTVAQYAKDFRHYHFIIMSHNLLQKTVENFRDTTFARVILDECHLALGPKTKKSISRIKYDTFWLLSGTPFKTEEPAKNELLTYIHWLSMASEKINNNNCNRDNFQALIVYRTKESIQGISFPKKILVNVLHLTSDKEKEIQDILNRYKRNEELKNNYIAIFTLVQKKRQACIHWWILLESLHRSVKGIVSEEEVKSCSKASEGVKLLKKLISGDLSKKVYVSVEKQCSFCDTKSNYTEELNCKTHYCCCKCLQQLDSTECTKCLTKLTRVSPSAITNWKEFEEGSRYLEIIQILSVNKESFIIFSEFVVALELLENILKNKHPQILSGRTILLYSGKSTEKEKSQIHGKIDKGSPVVALVSIKSGGTGLNLQKVRNVILLEPQWNPITEDQAIGRCHRIGQNSDVIIRRLLSEGTIEERVQQVQKKKIEARKTMLGIPIAVSRVSITRTQLREMLDLNE